MKKSSYLFTTLAIVHICMIRSSFLASILPKNGQYQSTNIELMIQDNENEYMYNIIRKLDKNHIKEVEE